MIYGWDALGGARYQKTVLAEQPRSYGFGVFAEVDGFGKAYSLIDQVAKLGVPFIRVQMIWRDDHNFTSRDLPTLEQRCRALKAVTQKHPSVKFLISPCCEHNLNERQFQPFADVVQKHFGSVFQIVNSPNHNKGHRSTKYQNEFHNSDSRARAGDGFSFDGANCVDSDVEKYKAKGFKYLMIWNSQCNGRRNLEDKTPRAQRKFWPTAKQIDSWIWLTTRSKGSVRMPAKWLLKSHSDQHTNPPSGKDQKPVFIVPVKASAIVLKARNGQVIDTARYFGSFQGGGFRYYCTQWGFELAQKAIRIQGDAICDLYVNNKKVGTVNPAFREGNYR